jgi:hypothetical protein
MIKVAMYRSQSDDTGDSYRAIAAHSQAAGRTAGEALDALAKQMPDQEADTVIIVRNLGPDRFFTADQCQRLELLVEKSRSARDAGGSLSALEQSELEQLIDEEIQGAGERAAALRRELGP